ncbi:LytTR family two component transcriptional regulator [Chitinophaga niastensis]|uniref:LytTR family two component transcriptional regulator n=1 Tax=Chitinophaga niastensis TaxID=536980 RepID=A0A2P8H9D0_CHINA|nr:response regulator transcription factor [Chitinophaga niastensis]PSL42828.1 LytTR family two component transcriptional regulator [Chitinophaga niastensis]
MLKCVIIDDEKFAISVLTHHIEKTDYLQLVGSATNALEGLEIIKKHDADLVFLDVRMPELTGIELLSLIPQRCKVILTTAHAEYAIDGFENEVVDYLLKPISLSRFLKACFKVNSIILQSGSPIIKDQDYIFVKSGTKGKLIKIYPSQVFFLESFKNFVKIYLEENCILVAGNLKDFEAVFIKPIFIRVHRSYIVSIPKIKIIEQGLAIFHPDLKPVPIGDSYKEEFYNLIDRNIFR